MATFGNTTAGSDTFPCSNDRCIASKFTLTETGNVTSMTARFDASSTAGTNFKPVIYNDSAGSPGARNTVGSATAVPAGGGAIQATITATLSAGDYWLGYVCDSSTAVAEIELTGTGQRKESLTYASPADPFGTPDGSLAEVCIYATYTGGPGSPPIANAIDVAQYRGKGKRSSGMSWGLKASEWW